MGDDGYTYHNVIDGGSDLAGHWVVAAVLYSIVCMIGYALLLLCTQPVDTVASDMASNYLWIISLGVFFSTAHYYSHWMVTTAYRNGTGQSFDDEYIRQRYRDGTLRGYLWKTKDGRRFIEVTDETK